MRLSYFKHAGNAMLKSDYHGAGSSPRIGVVAEYKGAIIAEAWNTDKTSVLQNKYNRLRFHNPALPAKNHAETNLCQRIRWKFGDSLDWSRVHLYLYRELKNGSLAMSRPCNACMAMLRDFGIEEVYYTTENGYAQERIKGKEDI